MGGIGGLLNVGSNIPVAGKYVKKIKGEVDDTLGGIGNTMKAATPYSQEAQEATENAATQGPSGQNNATSAAPSRISRPPCLIKNYPRGFSAATSAAQKDLAAKRIAEMTRLARTVPPPV
jgi:hypothetical protein